MAAKQDVIDLIEQDHRRVEQLFKKLESDGTSESEKETLLQQVADELIPHSKGEEDVVYPAITASLPDEREDVADGVAEHHHVEETLRQLLAISPDDPGADGLLAAMIAEVRHHVEEEEQDILPAYREATDVGERAAVAADFAARKEQERAARGLPPADAGSAGLVDLTRDELYERAKQSGVEGRSDMTKDQLIKALGGR